MPILSTGMKMIHRTRTRCRTGRVLGMVVGLALGTSTLTGSFAGAAAAIDGDEDSDTADTSDDTQSSTWPVVSTGLDPVSPELAARAAGILNFPGDAPGVYAAFGVPAEMPIPGNMTLIAARVDANLSPGQPNHSEIFAMTFIGESPTAPDPAATNARIAAAVAPAEAGWSANSGTEERDGAVAHYIRVSNPDFDQRVRSLTVWSTVNVDGFFVVSLEMMQRVDSADGQPVTTLQLPAYLAEHSTLIDEAAATAQGTVSDWSVRFGLGGFIFASESHSWDIRLATPPGGDVTALGELFCALHDEQPTAGDNNSSCYASAGSVYVGAPYDDTTGPNVRVSGEFPDLPAPEVGSVSVPVEPPVDLSSTTVPAKPAGVGFPPLDTATADTAWLDIPSGLPELDSLTAAGAAAAIPWSNDPATAYAEFGLPPEMPIFEGMALIALDVRQNTQPGDGSLNGRYEAVYIGNASAGVDLPTVVAHVTAAIVPDTSSWTVSAGERSDDDGVTHYTDLYNTDSTAALRDVEVRAAEHDGLLLVAVEVSTTSGTAETPAALTVPATVAAAAEFAAGVVGELGGEPTAWSAWLGNTGFSFGGPSRSWTIDYGYPGEMAEAEPLCALLESEMNVTDDYISCGGQTFGAARVHVSPATDYRPTTLQLSGQFDSF